MSKVSVAIRDVNTLYQVVRPRLMKENLPGKN